MSFRLKDQFVYNVPTDWNEYLFSQKGLDSFKFYPVVLAILFIVLTLMIFCFFLSKRNKKNRALSKFLKLFGNVMLWESIVGVLVIFSRWQTLGFFAIRLFLLIWIASVSISTVIVVVLYFAKYKKNIEKCNEELQLSRYKP